MPDDMSDVEDVLQSYSGLENHPIGTVILRFARMIRNARERLISLEQRVRAIEDKLNAP